MRILLVQTGFLGDVVLSTPVIANLSSLYEGAEITVLTTPLARELVAYHPAVSKVIEFDKRNVDRGFIGILRLAAVLRRCKFDLAFSLHKSYRTAFLLACAGISPRYGFKEASFSFFYSKTVPRADLSHEVLRNLAILRAISKEPEDLPNQKMHIGLSATAKKKAQEIVSVEDKRPIVGLAPGSVWATKRWTVEGFAEVAIDLHNKGYRIALIGGKSDLPVAAMVEQLAAVELDNLVGELSLIESAAVISKMKLLITNDSAPLHIASALDTPVLALFCATVPEFGFGPWQVKNEVLGVDGLSCRPCGRHGGNSCPLGTDACMKELAVTSVIAAAGRLLKDNIGTEILVNNG